MQPQTSRTAATPSYRNPAWWTDKHTSAWERVKEAFRRDWEQTKADFSSTSGRDLNQNVGDTVKQAVGSAPIPPPDVQTRPADPKDAVREASKAREHMLDAAKKADETAAKARAEIEEKRAKLGEKIADVQQDVAEEQAKARDKIADAQAKAGEKIADATRSANDDIRKQQERINEAAAKRDEAEARWRQAEYEARYGYAMRMQRPNDAWDSTLERSMRDEWNALNTGRSWDDARVGIRRGWDYAGMKH